MSEGRLLAQFDGFSFLLKDSQIQKQPHNASENFQGESKWRHKKKLVFYFSDKKYYFSLQDLERAFEKFFFCFPATI